MQLDTNKKLIFSSDKIIYDAVWHVCTIHLLQLVCQTYICDELVIIINVTSCIWTLKLCPPNILNEYYTRVCIVKAKQ